MKGKSYRQSRRKKEGKVKEFEKKLDDALATKRYVEWRVDDLYRGFVEKNYIYSVIGVEVDLYSFDPRFNVKACRKNVIKQLYHQKCSRKVGRFVIVKLSSDELQDCKNAGLKAVPKKYRIYRKKTA